MRNATPMQTDATISAKAPGAGIPRTGGMALGRAVGLMLGALVAATGAASAQDGAFDGTQMAALPDTVPVQAPEDGLDLSLEPVRTAYLMPVDRLRGGGAAVTQLNANARMHGIYRIEIDLYPDDMRPQGEAVLRAGSGARLGRP